MSISWLMSSFWIFLGEIPDISVSLSGITVLHFYLQFMLGNKYSNMLHVIQYTKHIEYMSISQDWVSSGQNRIPAIKMKENDRYNVIFYSFQYWPKFTHIHMLVPLIAMCVVLYIYIYIYIYIGISAKPFASVLSLIYQISALWYQEQSHTSVLLMMFLRIKTIQCSVIINASFIY